MELAAHFALQRVINELVLLDPRLAPERLGDHGGGVVVAIAGEIADRDLGVRDLGLDQPLDIIRRHRHWGLPQISSSRKSPRHDCAPGVRRSPPTCSRGTKIRAARSTSLPELAVRPK